jgi:hypothetical protein
MTNFTNGNPSRNSTGTELPSDVLAPKDFPAKTSHLARYATPSTVVKRRFRERQPYPLT